MSQHDTSCEREGWWTHPLTEHPTALRVRCSTRRVYWYGLRGRRSL